MPSPGSPRGRGPPAMRASADAAPYPSNSPPRALETARPKGRPPQNTLGDSGGALAVRDHVVKHGGGWDNKAVAHKTGPRSGWQG